MNATYSAVYFTAASLYYTAPYIIAIISQSHPYIPCVLSYDASAVHFHVSSVLYGGLFVLYHSLALDFYKRTIQQTARSVIICETCCTF